MCVSACDARVATASLITATNKEETVINCKNIVAMRNQTNQKSGGTPATRKLNFLL